MSKFIGFLVFVVTLALILVWQQFQTTRAGYEIARLQRVREQIIEQNTRLECDVANLRSPSRLLAKMSELQIDLVHPLDWWRLQRFEEQRPSLPPQPRVQVASARRIGSPR